MFFKHHLLVILYIFLTSTALFAQSKPEIQYKSGFATGLSKEIAGGNTNPTLIFSYYFGNNNCYSVNFGVNPYASTNQKSNGKTTPNQFAWGTGIGAGAFYFIPLSRKKLRNTFFLAQGLEWNQNFGKNLTSTGTIISCWYVAYKLGFENRVNENVYFTTTTPLGYSQSLTTSSEGRGQQPERVLTSLWDVFNTITVKVFYLF